MSQGSRADSQYQTLQKLHTAQALRLHADMESMEDVATMGSNVYRSIS